MSDQHQAATAAAGDLELAGTTYRVEHVPGPGGHRVTYLVAPDGEVFVLRPYLGASTGVHQVVRCGPGSNDPARQLLHHEGRQVRVLVLGDVLETAPTPRRRRS